MMKLKDNFSWADFEVLRRFYLATMGIYLSSGCPVHCAHCAVSASSRLAEEPNSRFFTSIEQMCQLPELVAVAITGGEPFFELDLLETLVELFSRSGKRVVVYTSGYWGKAALVNRVPPVLDSIDGLIFGVDLYHHAHIPDEDLINALRHAAESGVWTTAQVLCGVDGNAHIEYATSIFEKAFGAEWKENMQIARIFPVPSGRARKIKTFEHYSPNQEEICDGIHGPTLLRNGALAACCNEEVVLQKGPQVFRVEDRDSLYRSLEALERHPLLNYLRKLPPATLWSLASQCVNPGNPVRDARFCEACWEFAGLFSNMNSLQKKKFDEMVNFLMAVRSSGQGAQPTETLSSPSRVIHV